MDPIEILFEDDDLLIVVKPTRCLVTPAPGRGGPTMVDRLRGQLSCEVFAVHRLDEDVTGAMVFARSQAARERLDEMFRRRLVRRRYLALVGRMPSPAAGRIESRLRPDADGVMRSVTSGGERAVTTYRALARQDRFVLVECELETGRRNQIRVHLSDIGCPIVGDRKYGYRSGAGQRRFSRPMLHAQELAFDHPVTGEPLRFRAQAVEKELRED